MRFSAPERMAVAPEVWNRPPLKQWLAAYPWLADADWPDLASLNELLQGRRHAVTGLPLRFEAQTPALLRDGLHYEQRSFDTGVISTRAENWHDLLNALIWIRYTDLKSALNARYVAELRLRNDRDRSRPQMAITHFDEGGVVAMVRDPQLLSLWDRHDWPALFYDHRQAWRDGRIGLAIIGHATLEHCLQPQQLITAKCLVVEISTAPAGRDHTAGSLSTLAQHIATAHCLNDPQELRPLPLSGVPGWHPASGERSFFETADCFRPLRAGRVYPAPLRFGQHTG